MKKLLTLKGILTALLLIAMSFAVVFFLNYENTFPALSKGSYLGTISGIDGNQKNSFYIERELKDNSILVVVFINNWQPQTVILEKDNSEKTSPLEVSFNKQTFSLTGSKKSTGYSGSVKKDNQKIGSWNIKKIEKPLSDSGLKNTNITEWLALKGKFSSLEEQKTKIKKEINSQQKQINSLSKTLKKTDLLTEKAEEQIEILQDEIKTQKDIKKKVILKLNVTVKSLEQLKRINKKGRTIDLARRVTKRETQWYLVNWGNENGVSASSEEEIARNMNIDYRKLKSKLDRSGEFLRIKNELDNERGQIRELRALASQKEQYNNEIPIEQNKNSNEQEINNKQSPKSDSKKPWWKKWDTVF